MLKWAQKQPPLEKALKLQYIYIYTPNFDNHSKPPKSTRLFHAPMEEIMLIWVIKGYQNPLLAQEFIGTDQPPKINGPKKEGNEQNINNWKTPQQTCRLPHTGAQKRKG